MEELLNGEMEGSHRVGDDDSVEVEASSEDASLQESKSAKSVRQLSEFGDEWSD